MYKARNVVTIVSMGKATKNDKNDNYLPTDKFDNGYIRY